MIRHAWQNAVVSEPDKWCVNHDTVFKHLDLNGRYTGVLAFQVTVVLQIQKKDFEGQSIELRLKRDFGYVSAETGTKYVLNKPAGEFAVMDTKAQQYLTRMAIAYEAQAFLLHEAAVKELLRRVQGSIELEVRKNPALHRVVKSPEHAAHLLESTNGLYIQLPLKVD